jgi:hypothetical protein
MYKKLNQTELFEEMLTLITNIQGSHSLSENLTGLNLTELNLIKLCFVFFLFFFTIFLFIVNPSALGSKGPRELESGFYEKTLKNILLYGSAVATFFSTGLAIKSELYSGKLDALEKELLEKNDVLSKSITELSKIQSELKELEDTKYYAKLISNRMENQYKDLKSSTNSILKEALSLRDVINNPDLSVTDKISNLRKFNHVASTFDRDLGGFKRLSDNLSMGSDTTLRGAYSRDDSIQASTYKGPLSQTTPNSTNTPSSSSPNSSTPNSSIPNSSIPADAKATKDCIKEEEDLNNASIINWDWFETLSSWEKLAVSLLLSKSIIFSALLGLLFNFYGDFLLTRFNIESRFPKLAKVIKLRRSFSRYYFFVD